MQIVMGESTARVPPEILHILQYSLTYRPFRRRLRSRLPRAAADRAPSAPWSEQILVAQLSKSRVSTSVINNATKGKRLARNSALPSATLQGGSFRRR